MIFHFSMDWVRSGLVFLRGFDIAMGAYLFWLLPVDLLVFAASMVAYYAYPKAKVQNAILVLLGLYAAWSRSSGYCLFFLAGALQEWFIARSIHKSDVESNRRALLLTSLGLNLFVMLLFRPGQPIAHRLLGEMGFPGSGAGLLGRAIEGGVVSFVLLSKFSLSLDAYSRKLKDSPGFLECMAFLLLFTRGKGVPLDRARDTIPQLRQPRAWSFSRLEDGGWPLLVGIFEISLGYELGRFGRAMIGAEQSWLVVLLASVILVVFLWLQFAGLVDLCRSFAAFAGIHLPENFRSPLFSTNIADFWRRWNTTLMDWVQEEVFARVAFRLRRWDVGGTLAATFATFFICGAFHRIETGMLLWWICQAAFLGVYLLLRKRIRKTWKKLGNPAWVPYLSWFATLSFVSYSLLTECFDGCGPVAMLARLRNPISWPEGLDAVSTWRAVAIFSLAMGLHAAPMMGGGDLWMKRFHPRVRVLIALGLITFALLARWQIPLHPSR